MIRRIAIWTGIAVVVAVALRIALVFLPVFLAVALHILAFFTGSGGPPERLASADLRPGGPGSLVSAMTMPGVTGQWPPVSFKAARVLYRSTSGDDGAQTVVSGSVFIPDGDAPAGGWPVVSFGHGTVGIEQSCAPSLSTTLSGHLTVVKVLIKMGYAVALADYQGLGADGVHPYLDSRTAGLNMIDAVRALRHTFSNVSDRWAALGDSQGGGASWAADEQASGYASELKLVGAVALSPAADIAGLVDKAQNGTLTSDQLLVMPSIIESLARLHPDLNRDDYRRGAAKAYWNVLIACDGPQLSQRADAAQKISPTDFVARTPAAADRLRLFLQEWALPQKPLAAPLSVFYGGKDTYIDAPWTAAAIARACALGGTISWEFDPDKGHNEADIPAQVKWMADRFAGKPAVNDCR